jgi:ketosteroid isomerase-like protein
MCRKLVCNTLILVLVVTALRANAGEPEKKDNKSGKEKGVTSDLEKASQQWYQAWVEKDAVTVERMMADDYVYVAPNGQVQDREAILRVIRSPGYRLHSWNRTNIVGRMLGDDAAVIRARGQGEGEFGGKRFKEDHALVQVWARVRGEWKVVVEQTTDYKP